MKMVLRAASIVLALAALAACSPAAEETSAADKPTPRNPFFGTWELTGARIAPWWVAQGEEPTPDSAFVKLAFAADKSTGPAELACDAPRYATNIIPQRDLFDGRLPDPPHDAAALGLTSPDVTVMSLSCQTAPDETKASFPMLDEETILLARNDVIYTYRRTGS